MIHACIHTYIHNYKHTHIHVYIGKMHFQYIFMNVINFSNKYSKTMRLVAIINYVF